MNFQDDHIRRMRMLKQAAPQPQTPQQQQQQTFSAAAQAAKGPWSIPAPQAIDPVQESQPVDDSAAKAEAELDKTKKELDAAKAKADKANLEIEKLRAQADMNRQHQQNLDKLKAEQEKLRALQQNRSANDEAEKARIAQHMADKKVELAEYKAKAMADIAQRNADQYVKTTDDAKKNADEYFRSQWDAIDKQREAVEQQRNEIQNKRYGLNSTVQNSLRNATKTIAGLSKVRGKMQAMPGIAVGEQALSDKSASSTADEYAEWADEQNRNSAEQQAMALRATDGRLTDQAMSQAHIQNMLEQARMQGASDATIEGYRTAMDAATDDLDNARAMNSARIAEGDKDAQRQEWQLGDMEYKRNGVSELDKIRHAYRDQAQEAYDNEHSIWRNNMVGRGLKSTYDFLLGDSLGMVSDSFSDWSQARDAAKRRGIGMNWFNSTADRGDWARQDFNQAMRDRGINATVGGNFGSTMGSIGLAGLDTLGAASMVVPGVGTAAGLGIKALTSAGKAVKGVQTVGKAVKGTTAAGRSMSRIGQAAYDARKASGGKWWKRPFGGYVSGTMKELGRHNMFGTNFVANPGSWMNSVNKFARPVSKVLSSKPAQFAFGADLALGLVGGRMPGQGMSTYQAPTDVQANQEAAKTGGQPNYTSGFGSALSSTNGFSAASSSMGMTNLGSQWMESIGKQASAGSNGPIRPVQRQPYSTSTAAWRNQGYTDESPSGYGRMHNNGWLRKGIDTVGPFLQSLTGGLVSAFPHTTTGLYRSEVPDDERYDQMSAVATAVSPVGYARNPYLVPRDPDGLTPEGRELADTYRSAHGTGLGYGGFNMPGKTYGAR